MVRLIRSKGVGVYFVTQNPLDVPEIVLAQLGNRVQHALRAFTPRDTKAVKAAADTFRPNPAFSAYEAITQLGTGEALVSTLEDKGVPSIVQRTLIRPPSSRIGTITPEERRQVIAASPIGADLRQDGRSRVRVRGASRADEGRERTAAAADAGRAAPPHRRSRADGGGGSGHPRHHARHQPPRGQG